MRDLQAYVKKITDRGVDIGDFLAQNNQEGSIRNQFKDENPLPKDFSEEEIWLELYDKLSDSVKQHLEKPEYIIQYEALFKAEESRYKNAIQSLNNTINAQEQSNNNDWNNTSDTIALKITHVATAREIARMCEEEKAKLTQNKSDIKYNENLKNLSNILENTNVLLTDNSNIDEKFKSLEALKKELPRQKRSMRNRMYLYLFVSAILLLGVALLAATIITHGAALPLLLKYLSIVGPLLSPYVMPIIHQIMHVGAYISPHLQYALNQLTQFFTGPVEHFCLDCIKSAAVFGHSFLSTLNGAFNNPTFLTNLTIASGAAATLTLLGTAFSNINYWPSKTKATEETPTPEELKALNPFQYPVTEEQVRAENQDPKVTECRNKIALLNDKINAMENEIEQPLTDYRTSIHEMTQGEAEQVDNEIASRAGKKARVEEMRTALDKQLIQLEGKTSLSKRELQKLEKLSRELDSLNDFIAAPINSKTQQELKKLDKLSNTVEMPRTSASTSSYASEFLRMKSKLQEIEQDKAAEQQEKEDPTIPKSPTNKL